MIRPAEVEVYRSVLDAFRAADAAAGDDIIRSGSVDTDEFVHGSDAARIAFLARWGAHYLTILAPARAAELREIAEAVRSGFDSDRLRRSSPRRATPRVPVRCDQCHHRIDQRGEIAA